MATINLTFNTTARQDAKLAKALARVNEFRASLPADPPLDPFPTVEAWLKDVLVSEVRSILKGQDAIDEDVLFNAYDAADSSVQDQVEALLGL
jgi:hypothetical protein